MSELISVIVPFYNVEKYLKQCVDSILTQTYSNLEIFLVDDGSTDRSGKLAEQMAKEDSRIQVIHKKNGGPSESRNMALDRAKGSWYVCVDSDDYIHPKMIETLYRTATEKDAQLVWCTFVEVDSEGHTDTPIDEGKLERKEYEITEMTNSEAEQEFYKMGRMSEFMVPWNKIYKADLFDTPNGKIRYPEGKIYEDGYTTYKIVYQAKKVIRMEQPLYYYRIHKGSIMAENGDLTYLPAMESGEERMLFYKERGEEDLYRKDLNLMIYSIIRFYENNKNKEQKKDLRRWYKKYYYQYFVKEKWPLAKRIRMRAFLMGDGFYRMISSLEGIYNRLSGK